MQKRKIVEDGRALFWIALPAYQDEMYSFVSLSVYGRGQKYLKLMSRFQRFFMK